MFVCPEHFSIQLRLSKSQFKVLTPVPVEHFNGATLPESQLEQGGALVPLKF